MKLERVEIKNFRSIKEATVDFKPSCRVLVGMNESGKSNILKALRLLDRNAPSSKDDKREGSPDEGYIKDLDSYVRFVFTLEEGEPQELFSAVGAGILYEGKTTQCRISWWETRNLKRIFSSDFSNFVSCEY